MARDLGRVHVRQYASKAIGNKSYSDPQRSALRTIVDFDELETTMRYLILDSEGGTFRLGVESLVLDWPELEKLVRAILRTRKAVAEPIASPTVLAK